MVNVKIGNSIRIGANSFVNKNIPSNCTAVGRLQNQSNLGNKERKTWFDGAMDNFFSGSREQ